MIAKILSSCQTCKVSQLGVRFSANGLFSCEAAAPAALETAAAKLARGNKGGGGGKSLTVLGPGPDNSEVLLANDFNL